MHLKKLGSDRRKTGRRKSRLFSSHELRDEIDEEDEVIQGNYRNVTGSKLLSLFLLKDKRLDLLIRMKISSYVKGTGMLVGTIQFKL